jgi:hypothetical protein
MLAKMVSLQKRFPMDTRHITAKNLVIAPFLINASIDELRCHATLWFQRFFSKIVLAGFSSQLLAS